MAVVLSIRNKLFGVLATIGGFQDGDKESDLLPRLYGKADGHTVKTFILDRFKLTLRIHLQCCQLVYIHQNSTEDRYLVKEFIAPDRSDRAVDSVKMLIRFLRQWRDKHRSLPTLSEVFKNILANGTFGSSRIGLVPNTHCCYVGWAGFSFLLKSIVKADRTVLNEPLDEWGTHQGVH